MERVLKHEILEFHPDTLRAVREACGLQAPGRMEEALDLLQDWIRKQDHFLKKDFPRMYLETTLMMSKGSIEKTKKRIDVIFTTRTLAPHLFEKFNAKNDFPGIHEVCKVLVMPKLTEDHYRVAIWKLYAGHLYATLFQDFFRYYIILCEYLKLHEYCNGYVFILDVREVNILDLVSKLNLTELRTIATLALKGYGVRLKSIHIVSTSKAIDLLVSVFSQVLSAKLMSRIHVHKTIEELHQHVPTRILPVDLGGEERSIDTIYDEWLQVCSSEEHVNFMREMRDARTDESRRRGARDDAVFGVPGTFRALAAVD